ncbi:MAG: hypothetical protein V7704_19325 [Aurantimonas endophytica]|uniref:hypothetical protein n=1 Tax=Aurantimonas endophytica TaxID=1522175 RepID=UPI0030026F5B
MPEKSKRILVRDLPGFAEMEAKVRIQYNPNIETTPEFDRAIEALSRSTFGVAAVDVWEEYRKFDEVEDEDDLPQAIRNFEAAAERLENSDEDAVEILCLLGIDFRDERGHPLLLTRFFSWQALGAVAGMKGSLPDPEVAELSRLSSSLEADARRFLEGRRRK